MSNMKSLYSYLCEARESIGKLPFGLDEFKIFMTLCIIDAQYDDAEIWDVIRKKFETKYPANLWRTFTSMCECYFELKDVSLEEFYKSFENIPVDRVKRVLGAGSNGVVLKVDKDKAIKIFYGDHIKTCDEPFIRYCYKHDSSVFPKVYKIGKNWCLIELLKTHTDKCRLYMHTLDKSKVGGKTLFCHLMDNKYQFDKIDISEFSDIQKEVFFWCKEIAAEMDAINSKYIVFPGDLVLNNIGERDNGEIIFFDI